MICVRRQRPLSWPEKRDLFGVGVSVTTYEATVETIIEAARRGLPAIASFYAVSALVDSSRNEQVRAKVNTFEILAPDGQPVRWALRLLRRAKLRDRVCGPETMLRLCRRAAEAGVAIYLYGGRPETIQSLQAGLQTRFPALRIAGAEAPPFRALSPAEDEAAVERINRSGAGILFIGLGYPKQDLFAYEHRCRIRPVQVCVGAAFDFHSGRIARAPRWMQRLGLEWCHRLAQEPGRLWRRYLVTNTVFLAKLAAALIGLPI